MVTHALSHTVRFKKEVLPGEKFVLETEVISWKRNSEGKRVAYTNGEIACMADILPTIPEILNQYLPQNTT